MAARAPRESPPPAQLKELERALGAASALAPAYLLRGDEPYFRQRAYDAIVAAAKRVGADVVVHDATDPDFDAQVLMGDLATAPMFVERQLVVARGVEGLLAKGGKQDAPLTRALLAFLERRDAGRTVLLSVGTLRADHAVAKAVVGAGGPSLTLRRLYDTPPPWNPDPRQTELVQWCVERARELRVRLDPNQALYLAAATGNDLGAVDTQLERIAAGGGDVKKAVVWQAGGSPFATADALCRGDLARSIGGVVALFEGGMVGRDGAKVLDEGALVPILVGSLLRGVREGLAAAEARAAGRPFDEHLEGAGPMRERAKSELEQRLARRPTPADWKALLEDLLDLDRRGKTGSRLGADDFLALALRWRVEARPEPAPRPARR